MPLPITPAQEATISPQAVEFLSAAEGIPIEAIQAVTVTRQAFHAAEEPVEESLIEKFNLKTENITMGGIPVLIISPSSPDPKYQGRVIFDIHGGGFVMVYSVDYDLSPEVKYPIAIEQCLTVYREMIVKFGAKNIVGLSSSAGGQIMLSLIVRAQREGLELPAALAFYTPNTDLSGVGDSNVFNDGRDLVDNHVLVGAMSALYAGGVDLKDELLSPVYAELSGPFPPTVINTGTRDILLSQCVRLYWKLREAGGKTELLVSEGMWHGFNWELELPEGIRARKAVYSFIKSVLDGM
ncbi:alpha/beta hydrolase fold domain-containing protein [Trichoderma breve]|uniref:Alpha/beta hydrolase fold domain-containing protein n=1 Tax=Trichoderma breve TaxID=2034170 RepID=A0A9W9B7J4_9HYPO|nr:alpha/beta hydrolase fold domain-containing protein [Trichoderma breve]KAJ4857965.1 alpha/beta hydrolase fold domain-containing protein [Trichoderma breve]